MNALLGSLKRTASVAASRAPLASLEASTMLRTMAAATTTTTAASRSFSSSSSDDEGGKAFTASLFPGDGAFSFFFLSQLVRGFSYALLSEDKLEEAWMKTGRGSWHEIGSMGNAQS